MTFSIVLVLYAGTEAVGASGLIAVLAFGLTLANFPGMDPRFRAVEDEILSFRSQESLLSFHSELSFLVRSFFFVLIGAIADLRSFRGHALLIAGMLGALFVARWLALQVSRPAFRDVEGKDRELMLWIMPRGLITIVLALQVAAARGDASFLSAVAFAVILVTNVMLVVGSLRASRDAVANSALARESTTAETARSTRRGGGCSGAAVVRTLDITCCAPRFAGTGSEYLVVRQPARRAASSQLATLDSAACPPVALVRELWGLDRGNGEALRRTGGNLYRGTASGAKPACGRAAAL
jgi:hypothetical protein